MYIFNLYSDSENRENSEHMMVRSNFNNVEIFRDTYRQVFS